VAPAAETLPFLDEHSLVVDAPAPETWCATAAFFAASPGRFVGGYARLVGVRGERPFEVDGAAPPYRIDFAGEHRFARYGLAFTTEAIGPDRTRLTLRSFAEFPGPLGRVYRGAVIGTRFHVLAVRFVLSRIARSAVRTSSRPS
jgi:hypothetical protein